MALLIHFQITIIPTKTLYNPRTQHSVSPQENVYNKNQKHTWQKKHHKYPNQLKICKA